MKRLVAIFLIAASASFAFGASASAATKVPKSCVAALAAADQVIGINAGVTDAQAQFFTELHDSALVLQGGGSFVTFVNSLTASTQSFTTKINNATAQLKPVALDYVTNKTKCRAGK